jgi:peptidoglycan hydrolase CwlO-like protein
MKHSLILKPGEVNNDEKIEDLQQSLDIIEHKLDTEIHAKQITIERQEQEIQRLHILIEKKDKLILETGEKLNECTNNNEGNRQLINKLLNDIDRLNQDIDWYKKTFEKRSLAGVLKDRFRFLRGK